MSRLHHIIKLLRDQRGGAAILFVLCLPVLLGFAALAVDVARLNLTKVELQNAADAAALGGVHSLCDPTSSPSNQPYNWTDAYNTAKQVAQSNIANGALIQDVTIKMGYWNLITPSLGLRPYTTIPGAGDVFAVSVTIAISSTKNNGPLKLFFAPILGIANSNIEASAIAVLPAPAAGTGMFPVVINMAMFTHWWDTSTNKPKLDPATGNPYIFYIGNAAANKYFGTSAGYWTTFGSVNHDSPTVIGLFTTGNTTSLGIGDLTYLPSGVKTDIYSSVPTNKDVAVYVVNSIVSNSWQPIVAIAGLHVVGTSNHYGNGSNQTIEAQFLNNVYAGGTNPGSGNGLPLGAYSPPILVQ